MITAAAGDAGYLDWQESLEESASYPSSSPHVVAVGGTRLELGKESKWAGEQVWNGYGATGGGSGHHAPSSASVRPLVKGAIPVAKTLTRLSCCLVVYFVRL